MGWREGFIAVDWGTTNRRAFAVDAAGAAVLAVEDELGVMNLPGDAFAEEVAALRRRLGGRPMLLAGMIGSDRGWKQAPYVPCPAGAAELAAAILWVEPGRLGIVPGVASAEGGEADVMRGEEVQAIGAAGALPPDAPLCHPGTHSKWIRMRGGRIAHFRTAMTGELYGLLKSGSILAPQLRQEAAADADFARGASEALAGAEPLAALFSIRARHLLGRGEANAASYASGLLVGADLRAGLALHDSGPIGLVGRSELRALYAAALAQAGVETVEVDGGEAFLAGIRAIIETL